MSSNISFLLLITHCINRENKVLLNVVLLNLFHINIMLDEANLLFNCFIKFSALRRGHSSAISSRNVTLFSTNWNLISKIYPIYFIECKISFISEMVQYFVDQESYLIWSMSSPLISRIGKLQGIGRKLKRKLYSYGYSVITEQQN